MGEVALRKARLLLAAGARLTLVSPELEPEFSEFVGRFTHLAERFSPAHLAGQILVVAATDNLEVNALVYQSANQLGLFVNVVDDPKRSSFIFPSNHRSLAADGGGLQRWQGAGAGAPVARAAGELVATPSWRADRALRPGP